MSDALPDFIALWDYRQPAETEAAFRALLPRAEAESDPGYLGQLLTQIARTESLQRRFDDAHATLDRVTTLIEEHASTALTAVRARYLLERGRSFNSAGRPEDARPLFEEAWDESRAGGLDGLAVDAAHMLAIVTDPDEVLAWNERALELAEASTDPDARRWRGSLANNIGWTLHGKGDFCGALAQFELALDTRRNPPTGTEPNATEIHIARWCIARCLRSLDRVPDALDIQRELEGEIDTVDTDGGFTFEELAECLHALERTDEARPYFARAHELLSQDTWLVENESDRLARLRQLAAG